MSSRIQFTLCLVTSAMWKSEQIIESGIKKSETWANNFHFLCISFYPPLAEFKVVTAD